MNIAFLTPEYPNDKFDVSGGIGTSIFNLSHELVKSGHGVYVLVYGQDEDQLFEENGIVFHKIKNVKFKGISRYLSQKKTERIINQLHKSKKIDLVEAPDWGMTSFIKPTCPVIVRLHGSDTYFCHLDNRPVKWINKCHERRMLVNADAIISVSKYTGDLTNLLFNLKRNFTVIPNSIDSSKFFLPTNAVVDENTILYFGTLIRKKGLLELPLIFNKVYEKNSKAKLVLIGKDSSDVISGDNSTWKMMQPLFSKDALNNVSYLGSVTYDAIKQHISKAKVCVFPTFAEALPVSWIEAMALGKPIVASNVGWAVEVIEDEVSGFLAHPKDHELFSKRILQFLYDESLCKTMSIAARKRVETTFDSKVVMEQNIRFYNTILENK
ncbi:MAG: glycosyltransferase family 4 protein [Flavobacterium sp.]